jgi:hypothetical protein
MFLRCLFLDDIHLRRIDRGELAARREQGIEVDDLLLRDLADLVPVLLGQLPVEDLKVLLHPLLVVALDDGRRALLVDPPQRHLNEWMRQSSTQTASVKVHQSQKMITEGRTCATVFPLALAISASTGDSMTAFGRPSQFCPPSGE